MTYTEPLREHVEHEGQPYVDDPIYAVPKQRSELEKSLGRAFGHRPAQPLKIGHERVRLRWMKPGPDGKLVPR